MKTLRKHEKDIIDIISLGGSNDDIENPKSPIIISLSDDSIVYAWNTVEVIKILIIIIIIIILLLGDTCVECR